MAGSEMAARPFLGTTNGRCLASGQVVMLREQSHSALKGNERLVEPATPDHQQNTQPQMYPQAQAFPQAQPHPHPHGYPSQPFGPQYPQPYPPGQAPYGYGQPHPYAYPAAQPQPSAPIIVQNAVNVGDRQGHPFGFHVFMISITGGLWMFIAPFLALRRRGGASNRVNFR